MGVSGCGKTTVGQAFARYTRASFVEGDGFHPAENIAKMTRGEPLNDEDRWPWLQAIGAHLDAQYQAGKSVVVSCSALRVSYRTLLRQQRPWLQFAYLRAPLSVVEGRLAVRARHFMPPSLIRSQYRALEEPGMSEGIDVLDATLSVPELVEALGVLHARVVGLPGSLP